jgi:hypothetical protein
MLADVVRVCESDMVQAIRSVRMSFAREEYESDWYSDYDDGKRARSEGDMSEKHKTAGLFFRDDAGVPSNRHLPPGLSGVKEAVKLALTAPGDFESMSIGVVWAFAGDASCSDYIEVPGERAKDCVNFGSQDWWISHAGYDEWCQQMADFLNKTFPYAADGQSSCSGEKQPRCD